MLSQIAITTAPLILRGIRTVIDIDPMLRHCSCILLFNTCGAGTGDLNLEYAFLFDKEEISKLKCMTYCFGDVTLYYVFSALVQLLPHLFT